MRVTFSLSDDQYAANDRSGIMVGLPLVVQLDAGIMVMGVENGLSWFERTTPGLAVLKPFSLDRCIFSGRVNQLEVFQEEGTVICQALLDCGVALRCDLFDPSFAPGQQGTPYDLRGGDWLLGLASLNGLLAFDPGDLLWQPVQGTIVDIQQLSLSPGNPGFGTLRWLHGLAGRSYAPDLVYVTVEV